MTRPPLVPVRAWPHSLAATLHDLRSVRALTVIGVATPDSTDRTLARALVRTALCETLAAFLDRPAASITLVSQPGQAIAVKAPIPLSLSLSHAAGVSVAALHRGLDVGIDVMRLEDGVAATLDWLRVARDYLGPDVTARLQATSAAECPAAFVQAWTRLEACLKCLGLGLTEWSPALAAQLAICRVTALDFPDRDRTALAAAGSTASNVVGSIAERASPA